MSFKVIIAGCRHYKRYLTIETHCDRILSRKKDIEIVSGGAKGVDALGEYYATVKGYPLKEFFANWAKHGKAAGPIRNAQMAEYADALIAFWDGKSSGTKNMIEEAKKRNLKVRVINI